MGPGAREALVISAALLLGAAATIMIGQAYPNSTVVGLDYHDASIDAATNLPFGATCAITSDTSTECTSGVCTNSFDMLGHDVCSVKCTPGMDQTCPSGSAGMSAFIVYVIAYTLMSLGAFAVLTAKGRAGESDVLIATYGSKR